MNLNNDNDNGSKIDYFRKKFRSSSRVAAVLVNG